jgi:sRNA-binding protein
MTPTRTPLRHVASPLALAVMSRLSKYFPIWPAVLPSEADTTLRPLAIGIDKDLLARVVVPDGMLAEDVKKDVRRAIRYLTQSNSYFRALRQPGAMRHDINGHPVEAVTPEQAEYAASRLPGYKEPGNSTKTIPSRKISGNQEVVTVQVPAIKVSLPLRPDQLHPVGDAVKTVDLSLDLGDGKPFAVQFSGKNYRKALRQIAELQATGEVIVIMQGRLIAGHRIEGAGLSAQVKAPKVEA